MSMRYDEKYVNEWRAKAITKAEDFIQGEKYYAESSEFIFVELVSEYDAYVQEQDLNDPDTINWLNRIKPSKEELSWFKGDYNGALRIGSLHDNNIGASYNPWLMFDNRDDRDKYYAGLEIEWDDHNV